MNPAGLAEIGTQNASPLGRSQPVSGQRLFPARHLPVWLPSESSNEASCEGDEYPACFPGRIGGNPSCPDRATAQAQTPANQALALMADAGRGDQFAFFMVMRQG